MTRLVSQIEVELAAAKAATVSLGRELRNALNVPRTDRNRAIVNDRAAGLSYAEIATKRGVTGAIVTNALHQHRLVRRAAADAERRQAYKASAQHFDAGGVGR